MTDVTEPNTVAAQAAMKDQKVRLRDRGNGFRMLVSQITRERAVIETERVFDMLKSVSEKAIIEKGLSGL